MSGDRAPPHVAASSGSRSMFGRWYTTLYDALCGRHPNLRPWHFQWLDARLLYASLRRLLPTIAGGPERNVLDVGCGGKPYRSWFGPVTTYVGIDVYAGADVDIVVEPDSSWPFPDGEFDVVLCSQVLEHVEHLRNTISEICRVLRPEGKAVVSVPFLYNEHGGPWDFRRFTVHGVTRLFQDLTVESVEIQGGVGSTTAIIFLNWWDLALSRSYPLRLLKALLLPLTLVMTGTLNLLAVLLDSFDRTESFYSNVLLVVSKHHLDRAGSAIQ